MTPAPDPGTTVDDRAAAAAEGGDVRSRDGVGELELADEAAAGQRAGDLRLARLHLRTGAIQLARAELEAAHARADLNGALLLDLAEVRWRTGDLPAAGRAAEHYLATEGDAALAVVIAAEAAMHEGRAADARSAQAASEGLKSADLDAIFAGMPRSGLWPPDPLGGPSGSGPQPGRSRAGGPTWRGGQPESEAAGERPARSTRGAPARWGEEAGAASGRGGRSGEPDAPDPAAELAAASSDLDSGDMTAAAIRLALILRRAPQLAPAVIDLLDGVAGPNAALLRGDAFRIVGRETEAAQAWADAAAELRPAELPATDLSSAATELPAAGPSLPAADSSSPAQRSPSAPDVTASQKETP